ncbi:hypothetical protein JOL62DRAFT_622357 [Phyllosticta paracitricarpa]|uniref:Uncharacterized protein n=1 Tax=Phyllosticta paracitricarpa TaxID=2016321 RepID=A0ABR1NKY3_9PEZI
MEFVPATEAGWAISEYENSDKLNLEETTRDTAAYVHYFRYNALPPSSVRATAKPRLGQLSWDLESHERRCAGIAQRLQNEVWGLPAEDMAIDNWPFLPKFVLALVTFDDRLALLQNLMCDFIATADTPTTGTLHEKIIRKERQRYIEKRFEKYKQQAEVTLSNCVRKLEATSGAASPSDLRTPREEQSKKRERERIQKRLECLNFIQRMAMWARNFDFDVAASIYWAFHPTVAIERNYYDKGMGAVMTQRFCVACDRIWFLYVEPHLAKDMFRRENGSNGNAFPPQKAAKANEIHQIINEVHAKIFGASEILKSSIEAVIVPQLTPLCTAKKKRARCTSPTPEVLSAVAKERKAN